MSLFTVIWSMVAGASLTLALVHGLVSELQTKEAELRRSEEHLRVAAEASGAGLWALEGAAGRLGGEFSIESQSGGGSTILAWVPLKGEFA